MLEKMILEEMAERDKTANMKRRPTGRDGQLTEIANRKTILEESTGRYSKRQPILLETILEETTGTVRDN